MNTMYGLFLRTYDYYQWTNLKAVSTSKEKLEEKYKQLEDAEFNPDFPEDACRLVTEDESALYKKRGESHYVILPVEVV